MLATTEEEKLSSLLSGVRVLRMKPFFLLPTRRHLAHLAPVPIQSS